MWLSWGTTPKQLCCKFLLKIFCIFFFSLQLHLAGLASLKNDIVEISSKLEQVKQERDSLQGLLQRSAQERKEIIRDYEERLSTQAQQSEQHITELQSVIAELNKKLLQNSANKIDELEEIEIESQTSEHGEY